MTRSISVILPCLNEELGLRATYEGARDAAERHFKRFEILIVNDGSDDATGSIADAIAAADKRVRVFHNPTNHGYGYSCWQGADSARMAHIVAIPSDNEIEPASVDALFQAVGSADLVLAYPSNQRVRPRGRRVLSWAFTATMNAVTGHRLRYYNGPVVYKREHLPQVGRSTDGFAWQAAAVAKLVRSGCSFAHVGIRLRPMPGRRSKAFRPRVIAGVVGQVLRLAYDFRMRPGGSRPSG